MVLVLCIVFFFLNPKSKDSVISPELGYLVSFYCNLSSPNNFHRYFHGSCFDELYSLSYLLYEFKNNIRLLGGCHHFDVEIAK